MDRLPSDSITKLCMETFDDADILSAREELYKHVPEEVNDSTNLPRQRRGANQKHNSMNDIIQMLHIIDPDKRPRYAAINLTALPPITLDTVDVCTITRQINFLMNEAKVLRETVATAQEERERMSSEIIALSTQVADKPPNTKARSYASVTASAKRKVVTPPSSSDMMCNNEETPKQDAPASEGPSPEHNGNDFILVENKRRPRHVIRGQAQDTVGIKAAPKPARKHKYFISRLDVNTTVDCLKSYLSDKSYKVTEIQSLKTKFPGYKSFMVAIEVGTDDDKNKDGLMDPDLWPSDIIVRRYFDRSKKNMSHVNDEQS